MTTGTGTVTVTRTDRLDVALHGMRGGLRRGEPGCPWLVRRDTPSDDFATTPGRDVILSGQ